MSAQIGDTLHYEGTKYTMASEPPLNPPARAKYDIRFFSLCTACERGYQARWEVKAGKLFIKGIRGRAYVTDKEKFRKQKLRLRKLMGKGEITPSEGRRLLREAGRNLRKDRNISLYFLYGSREPVFASWVSGTIRVPKGKMLNYEHFGYESTFEEDLVLTFSKGILTESQVQKNFFLSFDDL